MCALVPAHAAWPLSPRTCSGTPLLEAHLEDLERSRPLRSVKRSSWLRGSCICGLSRATVASEDRLSRTCLFTLNSQNETSSPIRAQCGMNQRRTCRDGQSFGQLTRALRRIGIRADKPYDQTCAAAIFLHLPLIPATPARRGAIPSGRSTRPCSVCPEWFSTTRPEVLNNWRSRKSRPG